MTRGKMKLMRCEPPRGCGHIWQRVTTRTRFRRNVTWMGPYGGSSGGWALMSDAQFRERWPGCAPHVMSIPAFSPVFTMAQELIAFTPRPGPCPGP
jgi:hypothetical protein